MKSFTGNFYRQHIPKLIQQKLDLYRGQSQVFWPHFIDTKTLFIHIPKAGGSSIGSALYGRNVGHRTAIEYSRISTTSFNKLFSFAFTRNPWDRCVSAYHFAKQDGTSVVSIPNKEKYLKSEFSSFESFVCNWLLKADLANEDLIFQPQWWFVCDDKNRIIINFVGKLENIYEDIKVIEKVLNKEIKIPKINQSSRGSQSYRDYYTDETKAIVHSIYKKDIELFGYEF